MGDVETFAERIERKKRERDGIPTPPPEFDPALIPDPGPTREYQPNDLDVLIKGFPIVDAYNRFIPKEHVTGTGVEIKVSCPIPGHIDDVESACLNTEKNVWDCYVCETGGDIYDLAACKFGYPNYKNDKEHFKALRAIIAQELGFAVGRSSVTGKEYIVPTAAEAPELHEQPAENGAKALVRGLEASSSSKSVSSSDVVSLPSGEKYEQDQEHRRLFKIDWRVVCPQNTFLRRFCEIGSQDDLPEEYYFWLGLLGVGMALGRATHLADYPPVHGNLYMSLLGPTGQGKSKAINNMIRLLRTALPFNDDNLAGTKMIASPASAEALIDSFSHELHDDPADPSLVTGYAPIRGLVRFDEFQTLMGRASRTGSTLKPTIIEFFDADLPVELVGRGAGQVRAEDHFCTIITGTQPLSMAKVFAANDESNGFLNRWVFVRGVPKTLIPAMPTALNFDDCIDLLRTIRAWSSSHPKIVWTEESLKLWGEFFHEHLEPHRMDDESSLEARIDLTFKKIILLLCADEGQAEITVDIIERAITLYPYLAASYGKVGAVLGMNELNEYMQAIEGVIDRRAEKGLKTGKRELTQYLPKRLRNKDLILKALNILVEYETFAKTVEKGKTGQLKEHYFRIK